MTAATPTVLRFRAAGRAVPRRGRRRGRGLWAVGLVVGLVCMTANVSAVHAAPKLLLQDLQARGVSDAEAAAITSATCLALSRTGRHDVLCGDDLRTLLRFGSLSASFQACEGDSCFAQIGKALKARFLVSGAVSRLGELYVLSLSMVDTVRAKVVDRTSVQASSLERLQTQVAEAVSALGRHKRGAAR